MTYRYRKLTSTGDYTFGQNQKDFFTDIEAVTQACVTRLRLWRGTFWRDLNAGTPFTQQILGARGNPKNVLAIDGIIQGRILGTPEVLSIQDGVTLFNPNTRALTFSGNVQTLYSTTVIEVEI